MARLLAVLVLRPYLNCPWVCGKTPPQCPTIIIQKVGDAVKSFSALSIFQVRYLVK
jgi:hypothetical protein